ncbi:hypothetical protein O181_086180 [Austropuccinia psidii MF-1]|uniref:Uncharacterized protein n=1 Tax=Austropuccinia psidii MF-1 TaxID=1389203 RepID=A0A9Q3FTQ9_9BASI|nr:hypothetical protein [Austropuccinia psidii MF-1]
MDDGVRPNQIEFDRALRESNAEWSSYNKAATSHSLLPYHCIDLTSLLGSSPAFLAHRLLSDNESFPFACEERESQGEYGLLVKGYSTWRTTTTTTGERKRCIKKLHLPFR